MIDLAELARRHEAEIRPHVRLASTEAVAVAGRQVARRRTMVGVAMGVAVLLVLATIGLVVPRIRHTADVAHHGPIILDGGALTITPATPERPRITQAQAHNLARLVATSVSGSKVRWVYGQVVVDSNLSPAATGTMHLAHAWVMIKPIQPLPPNHATPAGVICRPIALATPDPTPPGGASRKDAVIVDADTGTAIQYHAYGPGVCGVDAAPYIAPVRILYSVAVDELSSNTFRYHIPPCAYVQGVRFTSEWSTTGSQRMTVLADAPTGPCAGGPETHVETLPGNIIRPLVHSPAGVVLADQSIFTGAFP